MFNKRRWSDGLHDDFDHLDEFEAKFYCFGGDGGGGGGGGSKPPSDQNKRADAQEPVRGGRRAAAAPAPSLSPSQQATMDRVSAAAQQSLDAKNPAVRDFQDRLAAGQFDAPPSNRAQVTAPSAPSAFDAVSFGPPNVSNFGSLSDFSNLSIGTPVTAKDAYTSAIENFTPQATNPLSIDLGPGTISPTFDAPSQTYGVEFNMPFDMSSSQQGIGSLDQNAVMAALTQGVNNPSTSMPAGTVQTAGMFDNVFGTLTAPLEYVGDNMVKRGNTYTSRGSGGITSTRREPSMYDKVTGSGKTLANQVGLGSLFD